MVSVSIYKRNLTLTVTIIMSQRLKRFHKPGVTLPVAMVAFGLAAGAVIYKIPDVVGIKPRTPVKVCSYSYLVAGGGISMQSETRITEEKISVPEANKLQAAVDKKNCYVELCTDATGKDCMIAHTGDVGAEISKDQKLEEQANRMGTKAIAGAIVSMCLMIAYAIRMVELKSKPKPARTQA